MKIALIADTYPPQRTSGAVQLRDLSTEFARQGHKITMMVAAPELKESWKFEMYQGVQILRLKTPKTKDVGYVRRTVGEFLMPFFMLWHAKESPFAGQKWDGIIWYSPSIFLGPMVGMLKKASGCKGYLIVRDIFPEWAVNLGLMGKGVPYLFFKIIENYQYSVADIIGIQSPGNSFYFTKWLARSSGRLEVLQNWLSSPSESHCSLRVRDTPLRGRTIFVYAGNMGTAQGMGILLDVAYRLSARSDIGFLFVGRGSAVPKLRAEAHSLCLDNVFFFDEIDPDEIPGLYAQCHVGMLALDPRHKTHNIPGKFLSYMQSGLPVLAAVNAGNDLVELILAESVGRVGTDASSQTLSELAVQLLEDMTQDEEYASRCKALSVRLFSPEVAVRQIVEALQL